MGGRIFFFVIWVRIWKDFGHLVESSNLNLSWYSLEITVINVLRRHIIVGSFTGQIHLYSALTAQLALTCAAHCRPVTSISVAPESAYVSIFLENLSAETSSSSAWILKFCYACPSDVIVPFSHCLTEICIWRMSGSDPILWNSFFPCASWSFLEFLHRPGENRPNSFWLGIFQSCDLF